MQTCLSMEATEVARYPMPLTMEGAWPRHSLPGSSGGAPPHHGAVGGGPDLASFEPEAEAQFSGRDPESGAPGLPLPHAGGSYGAYPGAMPFHVMQPGSGVDAGVPLRHEPLVRSAGHPAVQAQLQLSLLQSDPCFLPPIV